MYRVLVHCTHTHTHTHTHLCAVEVVHLTGLVAANDIQQRVCCCHGWTGAPHRHGWTLKPFVLRPQQEQEEEGERGLLLFIYYLL